MLPDQDVGRAVDGEVGGDEFWSLRTAARASEAVSFLDTSARGRGTNLYSICLLMGLSIERASSELNSK